MTQENSSKYPVIIADDHELIRTGLRIVIQGSPEFYIAAETDSAEALPGLLESGPCKILILDLHMPDGRNSGGLPDFRSEADWSGLHLLKLVKEKFPGVSVLIMTQYDDPVVVHEANRFNVDGFILKNEVNDVIIEALQSLVRGERFFSSRIQAIMGSPPVEPERILSPREFEVLELVANGFQDKEICDRLDISRRTVAFHKANIKEKLNAESTAEIIAYYYKNTRG